MACLARLFAPFALGALGVVGASGPWAYAAQVTLAETGSTLIYPVFRIWAADYPKTHPGVAITAAATNSGAGVDQAISGAAQIGVSDAYMSDMQVRDNPLIINVPMAISAQTQLQCH
jgi:phosphate transport system substrate-binding protein